MNIDILDKYNIDDETRDELLRVLALRGDTIELSDIWCAMDTVFDESNCSNQIVDESDFSIFYSHPIWLLNGIFSENDQSSVVSREFIASYIIRRGLKKVLDYGGGFGSIGKLIAKESSSVRLDIYEPHPSEIARRELVQHENVRLSAEIDDDYDAVICLDVFEHLADPIGKLYSLRRHMRNGCYLIAGNCFYPVIKCHLPATFHLRTSFSILAKAMGFERVRIESSGYIEVYRYNKTKAEHSTANRVRLVENISKIAFYMLPGKGRLQMFILDPSRYIRKAIHRLRP